MSIINPLYEIIVFPGRENMSLPRPVILADLIVLYSRFLILRGEIIKNRKRLPG